MDPVDTSVIGGCRFSLCAVANTRQRYRSQGTVSWVGGRPDDDIDSGNHRVAGHRVRRGCAGGPVVAGARHDRRPAAESPVRLGSAESAAVSLRQDARQREPGPSALARPHGDGIDVPARDRPRLGVRRGPGRGPAQAPHLLNVDGSVLRAGGIGSAGRLGCGLPLTDYAHRVACAAPARGAGAALIGSSPPRSPVPAADFDAGLRQLLELAPVWPSARASAGERVPRAVGVG